MSENVTVVIRSSGERTTDLCAHIAKRQVEEHNIFLIEEAPFHRAVRKTFELGISAGKQWTLALDADVLLSHDAIDKMVTRAEQLKSSVFVYQGYVLDYLWGQLREGGGHLYRTQILPTALRVLETQPDSLRPESDVYRALALQRFSTYVDSKVFGIHDYEQYRHDLFRKGFFYARKFKASRSKQFIGPKHWIDHMASNSDFQVSFSGWVAGIQDASTTIVDRNYFEEKIQSYLRSEEFSERPALLESAYPAIMKKIALLVQQNRTNSLRIKTRPKQSPGAVRQLGLKLASTIQLIGLLLERLLKKRWN